MDYDNLVNKLRLEGEIFDDVFEDNQGNDYFPGQTMLEAAEAITELKSLVVAMMPTIKREINFYLELGERPRDHAEDDCEDCQRQNEAMKLLGLLPDSE